MKKHPKNFYRNPHTTQERRKSFDEPSLVRPDRRANRLPNSYDDLKVSANYEKTWKSTRKTQELGRESKRLVIIVECDDHILARQSVRNIEYHLEEMGYSYKVKLVRKPEICYVIEYHGSGRIGDWPYAKYV